MVKTLIALRHMCVKEFGVELLHEKVSSDLGSGFGFSFAELVPIRRSNW